MSRVAQARRIVVIRATVALISGFFSGEKPKETKTSNRSGCRLL